MSWIKGKKRMGALQDVYKRQGFPLFKGKGQNLLDQRIKNLIVSHVIVDADTFFSLALEIVFAFGRVDGDRLNGSALQAGKQWLKHGLCVLGIRLCSGGNRRPGVVKRVARLCRGHRLYVFLQSFTKRCGGKPQARCTQQAHGGDGRQLFADIGHRSLLLSREMIFVRPSRPYAHIIEGGCSMEAM